MRDTITPQLQYIVVTVDEVDLARRLAHVRDKSGARFQASFRSAPGGVFYIPKQTEQWTAKRQGWIWNLEHRLDTLDEHEWVVDNLQPGDARLSAGLLRIEADNVLLNGSPLGAAGVIQTASHDISTTNVDFLVYYTFDLGGVCAASVRGTLIAFNPDGETPGTSPGEIMADIRTIETSAEQSIWSGLGSWIIDNPYDGDSSDLPLLTHRTWGVAARYVRVGVNIIDGSSFDPYAGSNTPSCTFTVQIDYR